MPFIESSSMVASVNIGQESKENLKAELEALQLLADAYANTIAQLPDLTREYYELQRRIRVKVRKIQMTEIGKR